MSTPRDLPDGYRQAPCCKNCMYCHDVIEWEFQEYRCGFGIELGCMPTRDNRVDQDCICNEYKGQGFDE